MADYMKPNVFSPNANSLTIGSHLVNGTPARGASDQINNVDFFSCMTGSVTLQQTLDKAN